MSVLRTVWTWWCELWNCDSLWSPDVDTHRWENKAEILRRLSSRTY